MIDELELTIFNLEQQIAEYKIDKTIERLCMIQTEISHLNRLIDKKVN